MGKLQTWIRNIKERMRTAACYKMMEDAGIAVFSCCEGLDMDECKACKYYVEIKKENEQ